MSFFLCNFASKIEKHTIYDKAILLVGSSDGPVHTASFG